MGKKTGEVRNIIVPKGYGFIRTTDGNLLFHHTEVIGNVRFHEIRPGDKVTSTAGERKGRPCAQRIEVERQALKESVQGEIRALLSRGFGYVRTLDTREDVFFHASELINGSFNELKLNQQVSFLIRERGDGRRYAIDVTIEPDWDNLAESQAK